MNQIRTLNQLANLIRKWAKAHPLLNDYGSGPTSLIGMTESMKFPYMWTTFQNEHTINLTNDQIIPMPGMQFMFMDKTNKSIELNLDNNGLDVTDGMEVSSDTYRLVLDFVKWITELDEVAVDGDVRCRYILDETKEISSGWLISINLKLIYMECNNITGL